MSPPRSWPACAINSAYRRQRLAARRRFVAAYPDLTDWFDEPLARRVGRLSGQQRGTISDQGSYQARGYLLFLGLCDHARFDYAWMLAGGHFHTCEVAAQLGLELGLQGLIDDAVRLGFERGGADQGLRWTLGRILLHTTPSTPAAITGERIDELLEAVQRFGERPDVAVFHGSRERYHGRAKNWTTHIHQLQVVLFHRGQLATQPRKLMPSYADRPPVPARMQATVDRWLAVRRLTDRPATVAKLELALRRFMVWLTQTDPTLESFAAVTREHALGHLTAMAEDPIARTGRPLSALSRIGRASALSMFFRDTAAWQWPDVPGHPLLGVGDRPKAPMRVPRFIPADELKPLMTAIADLECPQQRAALLVARWCGARQGEIRRLAIDCLDRYPDTTPRLRLPAGKTYRERTVPLHEQAAEALREVIALRSAGGERAFTDELTGNDTHYLFMRHGKLLSLAYLFQAPLARACTQANLVDAAGRPTVSSHRFRHTVGTQLAERGARLQTIMSVLGHRSVSMSLVYAQISDPEVLRDYQAVLGPGATIAGPCAAALKADELPSSAIDWLKTNFFKTELELGHCLRLPSEGPCECDLYLTCAKFVTTPDYAPRLQTRRETELRLADDAVRRGWPREADRHRCTAARLAHLLDELGEPIAQRPTNAHQP
ncbi:MAG: site-specific integrase [Actinobacteria bacterium]|nr:site-specific integrase [Actinomycetota bacterium]